MCLCVRILVIYIVSAVRIVLRIKTLSKHVYRICGISFKLKCKVQLGIVSDIIVR